MRQREFRNSSVHPAHVSAAPMKVNQALRVNTATCPAEEWKGDLGRTGGCKWRSGNWKWGWEDRHFLPNVPLVLHGHALVTFRHTIHPASTNKHGMRYIKESQTPKAPRSCWKGMWHVKWNLLLMQTSGLKFLAAVTLAFPQGPTAGLDRTSNAQAVTFRNTFSAQLPL